MTNLLKSDFYKLLRSKGFYISIILSIIFTVIIVLILKLTYNSADNILTSGYSSPESQESLNSLLNINLNAVSQIPLFFPNSFLLTFIAIPISIFCTSDFKFGTIKNIASKGFKREYIYLSKLIASVFICFVILLVNLPVYTIGNTIIWGFGDIPDNFVLDLLRLCGLEFLAYIGIASLFTMISMLIRNNGGAIAINICVLSLSSIILMLLSLIIDKVLKSDFLINNYWILDYPAKLASYTLENDTISKCSLVSVITIILTSLLGIFVFKKRDIK